VRISSASYSFRFLSLPLTVFAIWIATNSVFTLRATAAKGSGQEERWDIETLAAEVDELRAQLHGIDRRYGSTVNTDSGQAATPSRTATPSGDATTWVSTVE
jgi:hypothetical protein